MSGLDEVGVFEGGPVESDMVVGERTIWYPTASTRRLTSPGGGTWMLNGVVHAREVGGAETACGVIAVQWPMLFYRQFDVDDGRSCTECAEWVRQPGATDERISAHDQVGRA